MKECLKYNNIISKYWEVRDERSEWEQEWKQISYYLLPGRGLYQLYTKPRKRRLSNKKIINPIAEDSLYILTSELHGRLTSPSRPWFRLAWTSPENEQLEPLKAWLEECERRLHKALHESNFYSIINSFYIEYAGFGTGSIYVGEDTGDDNAAFRFELLTAGEYDFSIGPNGVPDTYFRTIFLTPRQLVGLFPDKVDKKMAKDVKAGKGSTEERYISVVEAVLPEEYQDKPYTQVFYEVTGHSGTGQALPRRDPDRPPLGIAGFYEFPYPIARWMTIGSDVYGLGPGSRALPHIKRLQEMEKAFLMATHKTINPPLNAPARMRGKLNTLPGGKNYYANPQETVNEIYQMRFDYGGVSAAIERVEERIQKTFYNDVFLIGNRDPNATPYKATEVQAREQEKLLRLGSIVERLQHEFLEPLIERCFNIMVRKELMPELPPELATVAEDYNISLVSPLATAQRSAALRGYQSFLSFVGQAAQFDQGILDNVNVDVITREMAEIEGVHLGALRPQEEVDVIRAQRAEAQQAEKERQEQIQLQMAQAQMNQAQAETMKTQAEAAAVTADSQVNATEAGLM